jgi:hypothetical protein
LAVAQRWRWRQRISSAAVLGSAMVERIGGGSSAVAARWRQCGGGVGSVAAAVAGRRQGGGGGSSSTPVAAGLAAAVAVWHIAASASKIQPPSWPLTRSLLEATQGMFDLFLMHVIFLLNVGKLTLMLQQI